jgi:type I restriction enzyme S subunit
MNSVEGNILPEGWKTVKLNEIGSFHRGITYKKSQLLESYEEGCITLLRANNIQNGLYLDDFQYLPNGFVKDEKLTKSGDIFLAMSSGSKHLVGKNAVLPSLSNHTFGAFCSVYRLDQVEQSPFVSIFFQSHYYKKIISNLFRGAGINNLRSSDLDEVSIPLPSLEEQKRIVAKIDTLFTKIDKAISLTEESLKQAENLLPSVLKEAFEKGKADGWEEKKLEEVIEKTKNVNPKTSSFDEFTYIDISAVDKSLQEIVLPKTVKSIDAPSRAKKSIKFDDILFATTRPNLKNIAIVSELYDFPIASTGFCVVRSNSEAHNRYLFYYLISDLLQEQIKPFIRGAQYPAISDKDLKSVLIPVPNLKEQIQVSALFDKISDESKETQSKLERKLAYLKQLKSSILSKAFKGEL